MSSADGRAPVNPEMSQLGAPHLSLLLLPGGVQEHVPVPVVLLLHVALLFVVRIHNVRWAPNSVCFCLGFSSLVSARVCPPAASPQPAAASSSSSPPSSSSFSRWWVCVCVRGRDSTVRLWLSPLLPRSLPAQLLFLLGSVIPRREASFRGRGGEKIERERPKKLCNRRMRSMAEVGGSWVDASGMQARLCLTLIGRLGCHPSGFSADFPPKPDFQVWLTGDLRLISLKRVWFKCRRRWDGFVTGHPRQFSCLVSWKTIKDVSLWYLRPEFKMHTEAA